MGELRKAINVRVANHKQGKIINEWLNNQDSIQDSITNVILHIIDQFGMRNITDFEVQKAMHQRVTLTQPIPANIQSTQPVISNPVVQEAPFNEPSHEIANEVKENEAPVKEVKPVIVDEPNNIHENQADPDDPYAAVDPNTL